PAAHPAWTGRGRLLPRHHLLPHAVVPFGLPRPHRRSVHGGGTVVVGDRRAGIGRHPWHGRHWRPRRFAIAVPDRRCAIGRAGLRHLLLPDRSTNGRSLAHFRGTCLARYAHGRGAPPA